MPTARNPYARPVKELFRQLALLNGTLQHLDIHLGLSTDRIRRDLRSGHGRHWVAGAALVIRDLTEWPSDGWARFYSAAVHAREGRQFLVVLRDLRRLSAAWAVSQGFERFESCLKDQVAMFLKRHPALFGTSAWRPNKKGQFMIPAKAVNTLYSDLVRSAFRGVDDLLPRLRKTVPALQEAEGKNNRALNLVSWLKVASAARDAHVHSGGVIRVDRLRHLSSVEHRIIVSDFPGRKTRAGYVLYMTPKAAGEALDRFAEYGQLVSKAMSQMDALTWEMPFGGRV